MSGPRAVPDDARARQLRASDPATSSFVSANAGSGKTFVLVQRVIRLMLNGVPPEKILCVTFTKAAAANMAERVFTTLGRWVTFDDAALDAAITDTGITHPNDIMRRRARELFACALETPGGLKVQTIHALCTRLLQQFPFESNVAAHFAVMDDRDQTEMMERAQLDVLLEAAAAPDSDVGRALAVAMTAAADVTFRDVVQQASLSRDHVLAWTDRAGSAAQATAELSQALGVAADRSRADIEREIVDGPHLPRKRWADAAAAFDGGTKTDDAQGDRLRTASTLDGETQVDEYLGVFFTGKLEPRKSCITKSLAGQKPRLADVLSNEAARLPGLLEARRAAAIRDRTAALLHIATRVAANYRAEKQARGLLDYDDLIDKTLAMLDRVPSGWVHYKLDRGIDHVLIDEAQDTSPKQWDIVAHLISEFTAGAGARDGMKRTVFAVGDEKQSIFSFQGAVPREFDTRRRALKSRFEGAELAFESVDFIYSFRSGAAILGSVDSVFGDAAVYRSIHAADAKPVHMSLADAGPSLIDLWTLEEPEPRPDIEGWRAALDHVASTGPEVRLAARVEQEIRTLIAQRTQTGPVGARRALRYGDVLILVRRRGKAFDAIIQALKHGGVPVAGADRLKLTDHIAVIDLMHLADALLQPHDDLALATVLKSPLFGLDDDDLFKLAWRRPSTLRAALDANADGDARIAAALTRLRACEAKASRETPFAFFAWLLGGDGGRARMLRRLGHEADDALDEFLELALGYERRAPATLQGFMAWLRAADTEVKRDMEIARDEVRVMTVHGAKGLEAPVVFLIDTTSSPADSARLSLIRIPAQADGQSVVAWAGAKGDDSAAVATARAAMLLETEDEYRRLLYVAMTRAADRLIVGGCRPGNRKTISEGAWYGLIEKGLASSGLHMDKVPPPDGVVQRFSRGPLPELTAVAAAPAPVVAPALPDWLRRPAAPAPRLPPVLRPSDDERDGAADAAPSSGISAVRAQARQRGVLIHRLLQSLPEVPAARRHEAALRFLVRNAKDWTDEVRDRTATQICALLGDAAYAAVFASGSSAEVPLAGKLARSDGSPVGVAGQVDRLVVTAQDVLIVDYKTGPQPAAVPPAYLRQLALYRAVLRKLYPDRPVRAALLWTQTPDIMELSAAALDADEALALAAGPSRGD